MEDLASVTTPIRTGDRTFEASIPSGWEQGRGAYGGLVMALLVRAIETTARAPDRTLRALTAELPGPTEAGAARIEVDSLRAGSGVSTLSARLVQGGEVRAHAVAVLGRTRSTDLEWNELDTPSPKPWRDVPVMQMPPSALTPVFTQHFEYRTEGPYPFTQQRGAVAGGWVRPKQPVARADSAYVVALSDAWWPSAFTRMQSIRAIGTVAYALGHIGSLDGLAPAEPLYHRGFTTVASAGFVLEQRELWRPTGELVAVHQQTLAVIR